MAMIRKSLLISLFVIAISSNLIAANYNLTWEGDGRTTIDGDTFCHVNYPAETGTCQPDDTITLPSGTTNDGLYINDLRGTSGHPIIIQNSSGAQTVLESDLADTQSEANNYGNAIWIQDSEFIKITGENGYTTANLDLDEPDSYEFGIRLTKWGLRGVYMNSKAQEIEICYTKIDQISVDLASPEYGSGYLGVGIKEESILTNTNMSGVTALNGLVIHHNYIWQTGTEGMYLGGSGNCDFTLSMTQCCDGDSDSAADKGVPSWTGIEVYENRTDNTGWDGISSSCGSDTVIYGNLITNAGIDNFPNNGQGLCLSLNVGFAGNAYNNRLIGCQKQGIVWQGVSPGTTNIFNNVISDTGLWTANSRAYEKVGIDDVGTGTINIKNNTIVNAGDMAIDMESGQTGLALNNLIVNEGSPSDLASLTDTTNVVIATVNECNFLDAAGHDYRLTTSTPGAILDQGTYSGAPALDADGNARNNPPDVGAYEEDGASPPAPFEVSQINLLSGALPSVTLSGALPGVTLGVQE
jgi:hypothetical protein